MKQTVEGFIADRLDRIRRQSRRVENALTMSSVTMKRRYRDYDLSDNLDTFQGEYWTNIPKRNFYAMNIIKPTVKANAAAIVSSNTKIDIEPRYVRDAKTRMAADVAQAIRDLKQDEQWTPELLELLATECQVAPGCFVRAYHDPKAPTPFKAKVPKWDTEQMETGGISVCKECGYETEGIADKCGECDGMMEVIEEPGETEMDYVSDVEEYHTGNTVTEFIPSCEIRLDPIDTQGGRLRNARWLEHHYLKPTYETGTPGISSEMSFPLRWQLAMQTGTEYFGGGIDADAADELTECRDLYMRPAYYGQLKEVVNDFEIGKFRVEAGKPLSEATYDGKPIGDRVLCFQTVDHQIKDVYPCEFRTFDEEFFYTSFVGNPSAFWGLFLTELLPMQDIVNYMLTLQVFHTRRNARTTLIVDSNAFDPEDFERDIAMTKPDYLRPQGENLNDAFGIVPPITLSGEPMNLIHTVMQYKTDVGGVSPSMVGGDASAAGYNTASGQILAKNQSMMQLSAFAQSLAKTKQAWVKKQLVEAQRNWGEEQFGFLLRLNGDWSDEHINAFLECNLETDLVIEFVQGSEIPRTLVEREMALRQFVGDLGALAQLSGQPVPPQVTADILNRIRQYADIDIDVANDEAEQLLIDKRYDLLRREVGGFEIPIDADPAALEQMALQIVSANPDMIPFERENHASAIEWLSDRIMTLAQAEQPDRLLIECLTQLIKMYEAAQVAFAQKQTEMQLAAQAPAMAMEQEQAMQQQEQQRAMQEEQKAADETAQAQQREADREARLEDAAIEMAKEEMKAAAGQTQSVGDEMETISIGA